MAAGIALRRRGAVCRSQLYFEIDDLIPDRVGTIAIGNGEQFAQPAARIGGLGFGRPGFEGLRLGSLSFSGGRHGLLLWGGLFFVHVRIIPRTSPY